ncbi:hypothetical protein SKAU_G00020360 [Synaphobranchus kaupii]|uniref:Large ribosomal subunit protein bL19m n=1 Tax=Synaphobranchus kaupii TaxID=118154 RepID=A0A9Q1GCV5_SYNKA|nr:hypothetical protein SKAU_G00020360 [Synaphobranchus kaupii]
MFVPYIAMFSEEPVSICLVFAPGVEICYELYNPRMQQVEVLKLEKRLDDNLKYLRDALPEYSTVDINKKPVPSTFSGRCLLMH